ncbi:MAG: prepilin-type N-terminal cleavage/methylation domain-containing protein [Acidithiobacillus sp.]
MHIKTRTSQHPPKVSWTTPSGGARRPRTEFRNDDGFTLTELIIVLVIVGVLVAMVLDHFNTSSAKGKALYLAMTSAAHSAEIFNASLGTHPTVYAAMCEPKFGKNPNYNALHLDLANVWDGPYAKPGDTGPDGNLHLNSIASGITIAFQSMAPTNNGSSTVGLAYQFAVVATGVPDAIAHAALNACDGNNGEKGATVTGACALVQGPGNTDLVYDVFAQSQSNIGSWNQDSNQSAVMDGGNAINLEQIGNQISLTLPSGIPNHNSLVSAYESTLSYNSSSGTFNGCLNISGTAMVGHNCGGNSGICGTGNTLTANSSTGSSCGPNGGQGISYINSQGQVAYLPASDANATGGPISFSNGSFQGTPIVTNWVSSNGQLMHETFAPAGACVTESVNGAQTGSFCP